MQFHGKTMENVIKHRNIKLVITEARRNYFVSEPNYPATNFSYENLLSIERRKTQVPLNKSVYVCVAILYLNKIVVREFWYEFYA